MLRFIWLLLFAVGCSAFAAPQGFQWDYVGSGVTGFRLYCGDAPGNNGSAPMATVNATVKTASVDLPAASTKYCVVTSYTAAKESAKSNEVQVDIAPDAPTNLRLTMEISMDREGNILGFKVARTK